MISITKGKSNSNLAIIIVHASFILRGIFEVAQLFCTSEKFLKNILGMLKTLQLKGQVRNLQNLFYREILLNNSLMQNVFEAIVYHEVWKSVLRKSL